MPVSNKTITMEVVGAGAEDTAAPGSKPRTKLARVRQRYIDCILKRTPLGPFPALSDETIDAIRGTPEGRERYRRLQAEAVALLRKARDQEDDVLEQYRAKGFAMVEVEGILLLCPCV